MMGHCRKLEVFAYRAATTRRFPLSLRKIKLNVIISR